MSDLTDLLIVKSRMGNWVTLIKRVTSQQNWWNKQLVIWNLVSLREKLLEFPDTIRGNTLLIQNLVLWKINGNLQFVSKSSCIFLWKKYPWISSSLSPRTPRSDVLSTLSVVQRIRTASHTLEHIDSHRPSHTPIHPLTHTQVRNKLKFLNVNKMTLI